MGLTCKNISVEIITRGKAEQKATLSTYKGSQFNTFMVEFDDSWRTLKS
jgi:hypothetical protein